MRPNLKNVPGNYWAARTALGRRDSVTVANNTRVVNLGDDSVGLVLHSTTVARWYRDGLIVLNSGGWRTVTTKDRMNRALPSPWSVRSDARRGGWGVYYSRERVAGFADGVTIATGREMKS